MPPKTAGYQWPMATFVLMVVYTLVLVVYLGWPIPSIATPPDRWPFLSFTLATSLLKVILPVGVILLSMMRLTAPLLLWVVMLFTLVMLMNSISLLTLMIYYWLFSNTASSETSFGNDLLYCCNYFGTVASCPASYGPCASAPTLAVNPDVWLLMGSAGVFIILEVMAFFFVGRMYDYYVRLYKKAKESTFEAPSTTNKTASIGPSLLPKSLQIPFFTQTVPRLWSGIQRAVDGLVLLDDTHVSMAQKYANIKKDN